jgi:nitrite reductase (NADH) small subunit
MGWVRVAAIGEIPSGQGKTVSAGPLRLALFNENGEYRATDDACPHQGASLADGLVHDGRVICALHQWVFDLRTGECPHDSHEPVAVYPTRLVDGAIEVDVPQE